MSVGHAILGWVLLLGAFALAAFIITSIVAWPYSYFRALWRRRRARKVSRPFPANDEFLR